MKYHELPSKIRQREERLESSFKFRNSLMALKERGETHTRVSSYDTDGASPIQIVVVIASVEQSIKEQEAAIAQLLEVSKNMGTVFTGFMSSATE